ncbi:uncharacterized protein LOC131687319 [Topomyia yanbarensis]|uniref:uncharacterized protein LOC131687319 n=1 Tax=Topomyia yanbarensis TaxID=2498891 RepID=UPI00273BB390|nr:uncharacterized protein LOC131687319 [Topomyia yanbarensis]
MHVSLCDQPDETDLNRLVKEYFSLEGIGITKPENPLLSSADQRASNLLRECTHRKGDRYESGLLWRYDDIRLPDSKPAALRRLLCLENRMRKSPALAEAMRNKIHEYLQKGYIRKLTPAEVSVKHPRTWYLPIFPVFNPNKPGKLRIVWDAAASVRGVSLNSVLMTGPDQLTSLASVLLRFREHRVAVGGDVREMFHQVLVKDEDQYSQRFLWRNTESDEPDVYVMQVMTFGASCSPSCAQYVKNHNALQFSERFPDAAAAIVKGHYVDDLLISVETQEDAIRLAKEVQFIHANAGFEMHQWISNSKQVLCALQNAPTAEKNVSIGSASSIEKVLGMWWDTSTDTITYKISPQCDQDILSGKQPPTKREMLRVLMMIFDPLGLIGHFLMFLKVLLQEVWRTNVGWDEPILEAQQEKWHRWLRVLPDVENVRVPRCYRFNTSSNSTNNVQLHTFVDASEAGYAAAVYLRFEELGQIECSLVGAKTRVAPLRFVSIPRLELQAALIGARLARSIEASLSLHVCRRVYWTDSRNVLGWLRSYHRRYTQYVAYRVGEILELTDPSEWLWVSTKDNVADDGTKWHRKPDLSSSSRWFRGPSIIWGREDIWQPDTRIMYNTNEELRPAFLLSHRVAVTAVVNPEDFSSWKRLLKVVGWVFQYTNNLYKKAKCLPIEAVPLNQEILSKAHNYLIRIAQRQAFPAEFSLMSSAEPRCLMWKV